jgi:hypothetical protein
MWIILIIPHHSIFKSEFQVINKNQTSQQISTIVTYAKAIKFCISILNELINNANTIRLNYKIQPNGSYIDCDNHIITVNKTGRNTAEPILEVE